MSKIKVYIYTRVSTSMQIDGYSLDAQKSRMKAFCEYNDYEIAGEYEDAGKSGKSIEGRAAFNRMLEDIKSGKDDVSFVLVFKLSRFGRNAADVLATLQTMQDFGVNLICVEDGIDSSKEAGKLMISVLSAVAEIERENIRIQTMEGRMQKAREGKWNGGFAPYGYKLVDGKLEINEEEAEAIRIIFEQYVNTDIGANGIAKYLENHGIRKIARQNGKNPLFDAALIRRIIKNPVYCGKIAYGRRKTEKIHGTRYRDFFYYGCKHRNMTRGHKCDYKKQINEELIDSAVSEVIKKVVSNPKFAGMMRDKINMQVDITELEQEIANYEKQLRQFYNVKDVILADIDELDYEDKHYKRRKVDLEDRLYKAYDKIDAIENALADARAKKRSIMADKVTGDNIYKALIYIDEFYDKMNESERREFMTVLLDNVQIYEKRQANGQWLKSMEFKLPIIKEDMKLRLDNGHMLKQSAFCQEKPNKSKVSAILGIK